MDRKKEEALVATEVETGCSEVTRDRVEDADEVDYDDDYDDGESEGDSGDSDEEESENINLEDLVGLKMAEKQFVEAPIKVFWDVRSCGIPEDCDDYFASRVLDNVRLAMWKMNYRGSTRYLGFGDCHLIPRKINNSVCRSGIKYLHVVGKGDKYATFSIITAEMLFRGKAFPSPTNYLLISGNTDLSITLNVLRKKGHNILVAHPNGDASGPLTKDASTVWFWDTLKLGGIPLTRTMKYLARHSLMTLMH